MSKAKPVALITGASSGIGAALARVFAAHGYDLILCARREDRLLAIAKELARTTQVDCITLDLAKSKAPRRLFTAVQALGKPIDTLVNNAGSAAQGAFSGLTEQQGQNIVALNIQTLTQLTTLFLPQMIARGQGKILNVASVVGFQAIPGMAVYSASKAYVLSFSESLAEEVRHQGITVCALCPGLTRTEMVGDLGTDSIPGAQLLMADPKEVAEAGFCALRRGQTIHVSGALNQAVVSWAEYQPRWLKRMLTGIVGRATLAA